jgi:cytochrome P450
VTTLREDQTVVLTEFSDVWDAFRRRDLRQGGYDEATVILADCLMVLHGDEHKKRRRLENRLFRRGTFRWWESDLLPGVIQEALAPCLLAGGTDLLDLGYRTIMNLTALVAGVDRPLGTGEETDALKAFTMKFSEGATLGHNLRDRAVVRTEVAEALEKFDRQFLAPSVARRAALLAQLEAGAITEDDLPRDVLMVLMRNVDDLQLGPDIIRREIAFYLQAGAHSTANAFVHAVDEVFCWRAAHPERAHQLSDDRFLQRCVHEAFRLHPASPIAVRRALADVELSSGRTLPEGALVEMDLHAANRDSKVYGPTSDQFDPERVLPDGIPPWGNTFGGGTHACIGMELDGGVPPRDDEPGEHVLGTVTLMVAALLAHGAHPDPDSPPESDPYSSRAHFGRYRVRFA